MTSGILFDVDGTLVDTTYLHTLCWHDALRSAEHVVAMNVLHRAIGMGSSELLSHVLGHARDTDQDDDIIQAHKVLYQRHWSRLTVLPGADALLRACAAMGHRIVLASSAAQDELAALRRVLAADDVIDAATSSTDVEHAKPERPDTGRPRQGRPHRSLERVRRRLGLGRGRLHQGRRQVRRPHLRRNIGRRTLRGRSGRDMARPG